MPMFIDDDMTSGGSGCLVTFNVEAMEMRIAVAKPGMMD
jgi:hypothetical protein